MFKKLILSFLLTVTCSSICYSENYIDFKKNYSNYNDDNMYDLDIYIYNDQKASTKIGTIGYFGDSPKINYVFQKNNDIYISSYVYNDVYEENPKYIYEDGKYNSIYVFHCKRNSCIYDEKTSDFFGAGGNILRLKDDKIVQYYPYKSSKNLQYDLDSNLFKVWKSSQTQGIILKKTSIYELNRVDSEYIGYLIKGDEFQIKDISSRWLNILYKSPKGKIIEGWIQCKDTNICREN